MATISGLYERQDSSDAPFTRESLRLDVDGTFLQMAASGTGLSGLQFRVHWVARPLAPNGASPHNGWGGPLSYKDGSNNLLPYNRVDMHVVGDKLTATFSAPGLPDRVRDFTFITPFFREVELEFDAETAVAPVLDYQTHAHPDRPGMLVDETLSINTVFERAGFRVSRTNADNVVPSAGAGPNAAWSDNEMHDAMQVHFSRLAGLTPQQQNQSRWALWTFFAGIHEEGNGLGGVMFDSIGAAERQGTALFLRSFIATQMPGADPTSAAWRRRMAFWTAIHEMGHAFNLYHAWQKALHAPWIPQPTGFNLLTFMNYPYFYQTGRFGNQDANTINFFRAFPFRFTNDELVFLRHAPERFVIMGGEAFGSNHALEQANVSLTPSLRLELRINQQPDVFEFLEPVVVEMKLTNVSSQPRLIPDRVLADLDQITLLVRKQGSEAKAYHPFAHYCRRKDARVLTPNEAIYDSVFVSAGTHGWNIADPGYYTVQACLHLEDEDIVSNALSIRVAPPRSWDEEYLAQDFFSGDVDRVLAFDGSQVLESANSVLQEVAGKLAGRKVALHAQVALNLPRLQPYKVLAASDAPGSRYQIKEVSPRESSTKTLAEVLGGDAQQANAAAATLGHIDFNCYAQQCSAALAQQGDSQDARGLLHNVAETFKKRSVLPRVIEDIEQKADGPAAALKSAPAAGHKKSPSLRKKRAVNRKKTAPKRKKRKK
jgi:hypothetical protein